MLRLIQPVAIVLIAAVGGWVAGYLLRPPGTETTALEPGAAVSQGDSDGHIAAEDASHSGSEETPGTADHEEGTAAEHDYVKLNNQFVIPVVEKDRVAALVILSLSLEIPSGGSDAVFAAEPKLRDTFLRVLFDHANSGGFSGSFTEGANLAALRNALLEAGQGVLGERLTAVLIGDIVRQDN